MKNYLVLFILVLLCLGGCKEFFESSLEGQKLSLLAPADRLESNSYKQSFWWEQNFDASIYRLQVVSPKFDSVASFVLDTVITADKFTYTLEPGKYQWRVRAENGSSRTEYYTRSFTIYPSSLGSQSLQLINPVTGFTTNNASLNYSWLRLFGATRYRLQVDTNSFADSTKLVLNTLSENLSFNQQLKRKGKYEYRARAENSSQLSKWSEVRYFVFDNTAPDRVSLTAPANKSTVSKPVRLQWNVLPDAEQYEVAVFKSDSLTLLSSYPVSVATNALSVNAGEINEQLVWRVRAVDKAGNKGAYSAYFSFTIR